MLEQFERDVEKGVKLAAEHVRATAVNSAPKDNGALRQHEETTWHGEATRGTDSLPAASPMST